MKFFRPNANIYFLCAVLCVYTALFTIWKCHVLPQGVHTYAFAISSATDALIIFLPYIFLRGKWRYTILIPLILLPIIIWVNELYFRNFDDILAGSSYTYFAGINSFTISSGMASTHLSDIIFLLVLIALPTAFLFFRKRIVQSTPPIKSFVISYLAVTLLSVFCSATLHYHRVSTWFDFTSFGETHNQVKFNWSISNDWKSYLINNGVVGYAVRATTMSGTTRTLSENDCKLINNFFSKPRNELLKDYAQVFSQNKDKSLVLIIVESLNSMVFDLPESSVVAPTLDSLLNDTTAIRVREIRSQVGLGQSSDAQLIYNTGLLPLRNTIWVSQFAISNFPSLAKALNKRDCFEVISEPMTVWLHSQTTLSYGYQSLYSDNSHSMQADSIVLDRAFNLYHKSGRPSFMQVTTISMHQPYQKPTVYDRRNLGSNVLKDFDNNDKNYLIEVAHCDEAIGRFINRLKITGLYDNTVIVIIGDHDSGPCLTERLQAPYTSMIILNAGIGMEITRPCEQADVFPTLLDIMGVEVYKHGGVEYHGMTDGLFRDSSPTDETAWEVSRLLITSRYWN